LLKKLRKYSFHIANIPHSVDLRVRETNAELLFDQHNELYVSERVPRGNMCCLEIVYKYEVGGIQGDAENVCEAVERPLVHWDKLQLSLRWAECAGTAPEGGRIHRRSPFSAAGFSSVNPSFS
jgi:hypothetical protein